MDMVVCLPVNDWHSLTSPVSQIQKQVHPRLDISDEAVAYLEELIYRLLAQICAANPHTLPDVETHVKKNFAAPIDTWALSDAQMMMGKYADKKKGVFVFPVDNIYQQLQRVSMGIGWTEEWVVLQHRKG